MRRLAVAGVVAAVLLFGLPANAAGPQIVDPANDANFGQNTVPNQAYADVLSVQWVSVKTGRKVTGFRVIAKLSAPPSPPPGVRLTYRMLGSTSGCSNGFGIVYHTDNIQPDLPQSALISCGPYVTLTGASTSAPQLTPIPMPVIKGSTITWTVPLKAIPNDSGVKVGSTVTHLNFQVHVHAVDASPRLRSGYPGTDYPVDDGYNPQGKYTLS